MFCLGYEFVLFHIVILNIIGQTYSDFHFLFFENYTYSDYLLLKITILCWTPQAFSLSHTGEGRMRGNKYGISGDLKQMHII